MLYCSNELWHMFMKTHLEAVLHFLKGVLCSLFFEKVVSDLLQGTTLSVFMTMASVKISFLKELLLALGRLPSPGLQDCLSQ